jgi:hypothetical protein
MVPRSVKVVDLPADKEVVARIDSFHDQHRPTEKIMSQPVTLKARELGMTAQF